MEEFLGKFQDPALIAAIGAVLWPVVNVVKKFSFVKALVGKHPQLIPYLTSGAGVLIAWLLQYQVEAFEFNIVGGIISGVVAGMAAGGIQGTIKAHNKAKALLNKLVD